MPARHVVAGPRDLARNVLATMHVKFPQLIHTCRAGLVGDSEARARRARHQSELGIVLASPAPPLACSSELAAKFVAKLDSEKQNRSKTDSVRTLLLLNTPSKLQK